MQSSKDKAKEAREKEKQANAQLKPSGAYVTIMHKDEKLIVGKFQPKFFGPIFLQVIAFINISRTRSRKGF